MIRVYVYPATKHAKPDVLLQNPVSNRYFAWVNDPKDAEFFYSPVDLGLVLWDSGVEGIKGLVHSLPHYPGNERRHFFHDYSACSDDWGLESVLFRAVKSKHDPNPLTISVPHWVDDFRPAPVDFSSLPHDVCFVGRWKACSVRKEAVGAVAADSSIRSLMILREEFWGYTKRDNPRQAKIERQEFIAAMQQSKLVLSPRGVELDAYRTWEGMSAGRPPIWIGDDYELPFQDVIDYNKFMFQLSEICATRMHQWVKYILATYTDAQLQIRGEEARRIWLEWFSKEVIPMTYYHYLKELYD